MAHPPRMKTVTFGAEVSGAMNEDFFSSQM
jgi:hypothetical protein